MLLLVLVFLSELHLVRGGVPLPEAIGNDGKNRALHVIITRFNMGQSHLQHLSVSRKYEFEHFSKPSLLGQSEKRFLWVVITDQDAVEELEREREAKGDDWYVFLAIPSGETMIGRHLIAFNVLNHVFDKKWTDIVKTIHLSHLLVTSMDVDDAISVDYFAQIERWYSNEARFWGQSWRVACSDQAILWMPDATSPDGLVRKRKEIIENGCLASGFVVVYPISDTFNYGKNVSQYKGSHEQLKRNNQGMFIVIDRPVLRMRSLTSISAKDVQTNDYLNQITRPDIDLFTTEYNIQGWNLRQLNTHLVQAAPNIANEILRSRSARGCHGRYSGSCGKNLYVACKILDFKPPQCLGLHKTKANRKSTYERGGGGNLFSQMKKNRRRRHYYNNKVLSKFGISSRISKKWTSLSVNNAATTLLFLTQCFYYSCGVSVVF